LQQRFIKPGVHASNNVEATLDFVVEATFGFVEMTKFQRKTRSTLLPFLATKSNVASTLLPKKGKNVETTFDFVAFDNVVLTMLLVWTGLYGAHPQWPVRTRPK